MSQPLATLLSQTLVALTIEADNEYEHRAPHFTSDFGGAGGPWLTSALHYTNFLRLVDDAGTPMRDVARRAGSTAAVLPAYHGVRRWGYATYTPDIAGSSPKAKDADAIVRLTPAGRSARELWAKVFDELEPRWSGRGFDPLRDALRIAVGQIDSPLPESYPVLGYGFAVPEIGEPEVRPVDQRGLLVLLSQLSMAIALAFEADSARSLVVCADFLRVLQPEPTLLRDLPKISGVDKRAWSSAVGQMVKGGSTELTRVGTAKAVALTAKGVAARDAYPKKLADVEQAWDTPALRAALEAVTTEALFEAMKPYPEGWRAKVAPLVALPHQPVYLQGGFPDGA